MKRDTPEDLSVLVDASWTDAHLVTHAVERLHHRQANGHAYYQPICHRRGYHLLAAIEPARPITCVACLARVEQRKEDTRAIVDYLQRCAARAARDEDDDD